MPRPAAFLTPTALLLLSLAGPAQAAGLLMFEEEGCPYCAAWEREIGDIYPLTSEAERAPLRRVDLHGPPPGDVSLDGEIRYTPTFVLIEDGKEVDRIIGYPGEDAFWGLLGEMLKRLSQDTSREDHS